jgi:hypothetical protein
VRVNRRGDVTWVSNFTSDVFRVTSDGDPLDESAFLVGDAELGGFDAVVVTVPPESLAVTPES